MSKIGIWAVAAVAVGTMLYLIYTAATFEAPLGRTTVAIAAPVQAEPESVAPNPERSSPLPTSIFRPAAEPAAVAVVEPEIAPMPQEIERPQAEPAAASPRLPALNNSDRFVVSQITALANGAQLVRYLASDQLVRKFVVFVENLSRGGFPQTGLPYKPIQTPMPVRNIDDNLFVMDAEAHARFDQVIAAFIAVDTETALTLYRLLSPLFQQAFTEIGFRDENFDDTLRKAINVVVNSQEVPGPYQLVKPSVMYLYADSSIENLQQVHKQLIRIGPQNATKLKSKLIDFASLL
ncbi:MAG: hypothetical protein ACI95C_002527 [Pseudohongiellaceae bacterium]|jgi:hypothetical protein